MGINTTNKTKENAITKIYLSGPISKDPNAKAKFERVQKQLQKGWHDIEVINPFEVGAELEAEGRQVSWEEYMKVDLKAILSADLVLMLTGWRRSRGARLERRIAKAVRIPIAYQVGDKERRKIYKKFRKEIMKQDKQREEFPQEEAHK